MSFVRIMFKQENFIRIWTQVESNMQTACLQVQNELWPTGQFPQGWGELVICLPVSFFPVVAADCPSLTSILIHSLKLHSSSSVYTWDAIKMFDPEILT